MDDSDPSDTGEAAGASGMFTVTLVKPAQPGLGRQIAEHWAYDDRSEALDDLGWIAARIAPGTELVLRDPEGVDLMRLTRTA